ncbi:uncharacterized protein LOC132695509 isoform X2 [Cylas formicarius]|nr:uncharacterized protein LOC132695509 isoform X2 [Cylas formicarius]
MDNSSNTGASRFEVNNRQAKFLGPLLGLFLANFLSNSVLAKFSPLGSIRLQYDPLPLVNHQPSINIYQPTEGPTFHPITQRPVDSHHIEYEPMVTEEHNHSGITVTNIHEPEDYIIPEESKLVKTPVKRGIYYRDSASFRRNRYSTRRRYTTPDYFGDDSYEDFTTRRYKPRRRNNGKRPPNFDDEYYDEYEYDNRVRNKLRRNRNKYKNRRQQIDPDYYSEENYRDDVERITVRPRQQAPPTTTMNNTDATTPMTNITTGVPENGTNTTATPTGYGYGPSNGNENISITYGPPYAQKPIYGPPSAIAGSPISEWRPSTLYGFSSSAGGFSGLYGTPSVSYQAPSTSYGTPASSGSYGPPSTSYGTPISSYGKPSTGYGAPSTTYGSPSASYGSPSTSYVSSSATYGSPSVNYASSGLTGIPSGSYSSYQLPYSSWYGKAASQNDIARRAQEIIGFDR